MTRCRCPTCKGLGTVNKAYPSGTIMSYSGPNGERWPQETCQNCNGSGWAGTPDALIEDVEELEKP